MGAIFGSPTPVPRPSPLAVITDLDKIEEKVKEFERAELIRKLTTHPLDENVEHLMKEIYMVLKILHGEEVGKEVFKYRENLLKQREADIEHRKRIAAGQKRQAVINSSKWTGIKNFLGGNDDDDNDPPF